MTLRIFFLLALFLVSSEAKPVEQETAFNNQPSHVASLAEYVKSQSPEEPVSLFVRNAQDFRSQKFQNNQQPLVRLVPEDTREAKVFDPQLVQQHPTHLEVSVSSVDAHQDFVQDEENRLQQLNQERQNNFELEALLRRLPLQNQDEDGVSTTFRRVNVDELNLPPFIRDEDRRFVHNGPGSHFQIFDANQHQQTRPLSPGIQSVSQFLDNSDPQIFFPQSQSEAQHLESLLSQQPSIAIKPINPDFQPLSPQFMLQNPVAQSQNDQISSQNANFEAQDINFHQSNSEFPQQNSLSQQRPSFAPTIVGFQNVNHLPEISVSSQQKPRNFINILPLQNEDLPQIIPGNLVGLMIGVSDKEEADVRSKKEVEAASNPAVDINALYPPLGPTPQQNINPIFREQNILNKLSSNIKINSAGQGLNLFDNFQISRGFHPSNFGREEPLPQESRAPEGRSLDNVFVQSSGNFVPGKLEGGFKPSSFFKL